MKSALSHSVARRISSTARSCSGSRAQAGHEITADASEAEVIVVNTCAFIDTAKEESVDAILEMAQFKRDGACKRLVVTGCLARALPRPAEGGDPGDRRGARHRRGAGDRRRAQRHPAARRADDALPLGVISRTGTASRTSDRTPNPEPRPRTPDRRICTTLDTPRLLTTPRHYAYVKIAEGCDYTCAFCIIPTLRGKYRSRDEDSIVAEAERLAARRRARAAAHFAGHDVLRHRPRRARRAGATAAPPERDRRASSWIRLLYLYPTTITDDVLDAMAECEKVCNYIDLPLQHASADVLRRMRRPGNREAYDKLLARIRTRVPGRHPPHHVHRRLPGRDRGGLRRALRLRPRHRLRPRRRVHLLARGGHARLRHGRRRAGGGEGRAARRASCACSRTWSAERLARADRQPVPRHGRRPVPGVRPRLDGPARGPGARISTPSWCWTMRPHARIARARSSTRVITGARGYDLVAGQRPSERAVAAALAATLYFQVVLGGKD